MAVLALHFTFEALDGGRLIRCIAGFEDLLGDRQLCLGGGQLVLNGAHPIGGAVKQEGGGYFHEGSDQRTCKMLWNKSMAVCMTLALAW